MAVTEAPKDRFKFQRRYPQDDLYAAVTGFYSYDHGRNRTGEHVQQPARRHRRLPVRPPADRLRSSIGLRRAPPCRPRSCLGSRRPRPRPSAARRGAVVALDPTTGAVLAMVTSPTYDPNEIASHDIEGATRRTPWPATRSGPCPTGPPGRSTRGSTFKLVTAAAALARARTQTKVASPAELKLPAAPSSAGNQTASCGGTTTITQALRESCNTAFATLGLKLGRTSCATGPVRLQRAASGRAERGRQPVPRQPGRGPAGAERDRPVRRPAHPAADGHGRSRDRQRRRRDGAVPGQPGADRPT